jgi:hypothetical protein
MKISKSGFCMRSFFPKILLCEFLALHSWFLDHWNFPIGRTNETSRRNRRVCGWTHLVGRNCWWRSKGPSILDINFWGKGVVGYPNEGFFLLKCTFNKNELSWTKMDGLNQSSHILFSWQYVSRKYFISYPNWLVKSNFKVIYFS